MGLDGYSCPSWALNLLGGFTGKDETLIFGNRLAGARRRLQLLRSSVPALQFTPAPITHQLLIFNCSFPRDFASCLVKEGMKKESEAWY